MAWESADLEHAAGAITWLGAGIRPKGFSGGGMQWIRRGGARKPFPAASTIRRGSKEFRSKQ